MKRNSWILGVLLTLAATATLAEVDEGSVVRGGRLYDDWMKETRERAPTGTHPALPAKLASVTPYDSWRCAQCHGFDYKGQHGVTGIRGRRGTSPSLTIATLKNPSHRYDTLLKESDLTDLANFVAYGQVLSLIHI